MIDIKKVIFETVEISNLLYHKKDDPLSMLHDRAMEWKAIMIAHVYCKRQHFQKKSNNPASHSATMSVRKNAVSRL